MKKILFSTQRYDFTKIALKCASTRVPVSSICKKIGLSTLHDRPPTTHVSMTKAQRRAQCVRTRTLSPAQQRWVPSSFSQHVVLLGHMLPSLHTSPRQQGVSNALTQNANATTKCIACIFHFRKGNLQRTMSRMQVSPWDAKPTRNRPKFLRMFSKPN